MTDTLVTPRGSLARLGRDRIDQERRRPLAYAGVRIPGRQFVRSDLTVSSSDKFYPGAPNTVLRPLDGSVDQSITGRRVDAIDDIEESGHDRGR